MIEHFQHQDWTGVPHKTCHCVVLYFSDSFHKNIDQDRDWIGTLHETFVNVWFYILVIHFTRTLIFLLINFKIETG